MTFDDRKEDAPLGKSKSPSRKEPRDPKKLTSGNMLPPVNLGVSYLTATVGNPIV